MNASLIEPFPSPPDVACDDVACVSRTFGDCPRGMFFRCRADAARSLRFVSGGCQALTGYAVSESADSPPVSLEELTHPDDRQKVCQRIAEAFARDEAYRVEYRLRRKDGRLRWVQERGIWLRDEGDGAILTGFLEDITDRRESRRRLEEAEVRYRSIFENSEIGMFQTSEDGRYLAANHALARLYGYESPQALMASLEDIANTLYIDPARREHFKRLIKADHVVRNFESEVRRCDGRHIWISENAHLVRAADGRFLCYEGSVEDITERRRYQQQLEHQASRDILTGLPNRCLLQDRLDQSIARANRNAWQLAVLFIDLDNFKIINDSLGHRAGDQLIVETARRLSACVRESDTVARYGGDEFVLILEGCANEDVVAEAIERTQRAVNQPVVLLGHTLQVSCSIGVALCPRHGHDLEALLQHADAAMYEAKSLRKGSYRFYTPRLNEAAQQRLEMEAALRGALERGEISVVYQPKVDGLGRMSGCEALARWHSPSLGAIAPDRFIPLAEETGLIAPLTAFVLRTACAAAAGWLAQGHDFGRIAVNLSAVQFREKDLIALIAAILAETGLAPGRLELEITESCLFGNVEQAIDILHALKNLGISVALDDFGTGYSSLSYLRRLPVDTLKIDRSFVMSCAREEDARAVVRAVISLGHNLGKAIVAEGVETPGQFQTLITAGCDEYQGFLFARPLAQDDLWEYMRAASPGREA